MSIEVEVWKVVPEYEDYQVSSFGNVKSLKWGKERILRAGINGDGYLSVVLYKKLKQKSLKVHILVAMAFLGHKPDGHKIVVDHKDNNKLNNKLTNLRLTTNRENCSKDRKGISEFVGVSWSKKRNKWRAYIDFEYRQIHLGYFDLELDAKNAYNKALDEWSQGLDLNVLYTKNIKTSQYKGVSWDKSRNKWMARYSGKFIGRYDSEIEAHEAVESYLKMVLNFT